MNERPSSKFWQSGTSVVVIPEKFAHLVQKPFVNTLVNEWEFLGELADDPPPVEAELGPIDRISKVERIVATVARCTGIQAIDIRSKRRTTIVVEPRRLCMFLADHLTTASLPKIGREMGG